MMVQTRYQHAQSRSDERDVHCTLQLYSLIGSKAVWKREYSLHYLQVTTIWQSVCFTPRVVIEKDLMQLQISLYQ